MEQLGLFAQAQTPMTVTQVTRILREHIESEPSFQNIWVQGEISNFSRPKSGHWYFTLKDDSAALPCVLWRSQAELQVHIPKEGESLEIHGGLSIYEAGGRYQFYVDELRPAGEGALFQEFLRLKAKLEAEGLFAAERRRPLPAWVRRIGIVTSPSGAALRDVLHTLGRRFPLAEVFLAPAAVQGPDAPAQLVAALFRLNQFVHADIILLVRGGGSLEDLAAFNNERLARAIVASIAPVISGVGHETDFTIADFAADLRAPTPTAAAELATPDKLDLAAGLIELQRALARNFASALREIRWGHQAMLQRLVQTSPAAKIENNRQRVDELGLRNERAFGQQTRMLRSGLNGMQARLGALNPTSVLERGYAMVSTQDGAVVRNTASVHSGQELEVRVSDGSFDVRVDGKGE
jgi:exodeoxyribonuclease VII large subunit